MVAAATPVREALNVRPVALDPLSENFLDDGKKNVDRGLVIS